MSAPASDSAIGQQLQGPARHNGDTTHNRGTPLVASALAAHNALHRALKKSSLHMKKDGTLERIPRKFKYRTYKAWRLRNQPEPAKGIYGSPPVYPKPRRIPFAEPGITSGLTRFQAPLVRALLREREERVKDKRRYKEREMAKAGIIVKANGNGKTSRRRHRTSTGAKSPLSREVLLLVPDEDEQGGDTDMAEGGDTDVDEGGDTNVEGEDGKGSKASKPNALKRQRTEIVENIELPTRKLGGHKRGEVAGNPNDRPPSAKRARRTQPAFRPRNCLVRRQAMLVGAIGADVEMTD